jgi:hypothetical protein
MSSNTIRLALVLLVWGCDEQPQHGQLDRSFPAVDSAPSDSIRDGAAGDGSTPAEAGVVDRGAPLTDGPGVQDADTDAAKPATGPAEQYPYDPLHFAFRQKIPAGIADDPRSAAVVARPKTHVQDGLGSVRLVGSHGCGGIVQQPLVSQQPANPQLTDWHLFLEDPLAT